MMKSRAYWGASGCHLTMVEWLVFGEDLEEIFVQHKTEPITTLLTCVLKHIKLEQGLDLQYIRLDSPVRDGT
jgi:hypothetical protein